MPDSVGMKRVLSVFGAMMALAGCGGGNTTTVVVTTATPVATVPAPSASSDAAAKVQARTAEVVAETYATEHNGAYSGISVAESRKIEPTLKEEEAAKLIKAESKGASAYIVETESVPTHNRFSIERTTTGNVIRKCATERTGGCPAGGEW